MNLRSHEFGRRDTGEFGTERGKVGNDVNIVYSCMKLYLTLYLLFAFICFSVLGSILNSLCVFTSMLATKLQLYFYWIYLFIIYLFILKNWLMWLLMLEGLKSAWHAVLETHQEEPGTRCFRLSWKVIYRETPFFLGGCLFFWDLFYF